LAAGQLARRLHRFFQGATWLWAGIFLVLTVSLAVLMVTQPTGLFLMLSTVATPALVLAITGASTLVPLHAAQARAAGSVLLPPDPDMEPLTCQLVTTRSCSGRPGITWPGARPGRLLIRKVRQEKRRGPLRSR
jgi:hypothetical protein